MNHAHACAIVLVCAVVSIFARAGDDFAAIQERIVSYKMENGLTVILYPRPAAPVISCVTYVKAGSVDEHVGITGIAHQLEHLAFKGTPFIGTKDYAAERKAFAELDILYAAIQTFEQKLPTEQREPFLSRLAQYTSTGGGETLAAQIEKDFTGLAAGWAKAGVKIASDDVQAMIRSVQTFAQKVKEAEAYVEQNQYSNAIDRAGGVGLNAFTNTDCTVYHISLPANKLELWASLESDRFLNTVPRQLEKEKQVVLEERRMRTESSPFGKLYENMIGAAFLAHPYGTSVIGHRSDILGYTREKIMRFYNDNYTPRNAVVCITGDIDVAKTREILDTYFGKIPRGPEHEPLVTVEPPQEGERRFEVEFPAQGALMMAFHVPERKHADTPALLVLDEIATSGRTSRMFSALVKKGVAQNVGSWMGPGDRYPRLFIFSSEPTKGTTLDALESGILADIEKLKTVPPSADELKRVTTAYRAGVMRKLKQNLNLAQELAEYEAVTGDWRNLFREIEEIGRVTPEQVTGAAQKYLTKRNRTVGKLISSDAAK